MHYSNDDNAIPCTHQRLSSYLLTTSDYGDSRPIRNGNSSGGGGGLLQRDKFCASPLEGDPDAICVLSAAAADLRKNSECAPA